MTDFATIVEQATSDHVRSGAADTSAADLRAVFGPIAQALRFFQNLAAGAAILIFAGAPDAAAGKNGDVYINSTTTDLYQKAADQWGAPLFQLKGKDGKTPKLGVDYFNGKTPALGVDYFNGQDGRSAYQVAVDNGFSGSETQWLASLKPGAVQPGNDGTDGNKNRWESYAPTNETGLAGDAWYHVLSAAKVAIYECYQAAGTATANAWRLRYTSPDPVTTTPTTAPATGTTYSLPQATADTLGGLKLGTGFTYNAATGRVDAAAAASTYTLPQATGDTLGGIKLGANLSYNPSTGRVDAAGNNGSSAPAYSLPQGTADTLGGLKLGTGLTYNVSTGRVDAVDNRVSTPTGTVLAFTRDADYPPIYSGTFTVDLTGAKVGVVVFAELGGATTQPSLDPAAFDQVGGVYAAGVRLGYAFRVAASGKIEYLIFRKP